MCGSIYIANSLHGIFFILPASNYIIYFDTININILYITNRGGLRGGGVPLENWEDVPGDQEYCPPPSENIISDP